MSLFHHPQALMAHQSSCGDPLMAEALAGLSQLFGWHSRWHQAAPGTSPGAMTVTCWHNVYWKSTWMLGCIHYIYIYYNTVEYYNIIKYNTFVKKNMCIYIHMISKVQYSDNDKRKEPHTSKSPLVHKRTSSSHLVSDIWRWFCWGRQRWLFTCFHWFNGLVETTFHWKTTWLFL